MANGNFLEHAADALGMDVGFGKLILIYPAKTTVGVAELTHTAINAAIAAGTIIGCIKGWHSAVGAPVAEINVERTATAEMKQIRAEIAADVLTFESNMANAVVLSDLAKHGTFDCILIDDQGNAFGDASVTANHIETMRINFNTKATGSLQRDHSTEKVIAVTARYLVKDLSVIIAGVETELVLSKTLLVGQLSSVTTMTATSYVFVLQLKEKLTGAAFASALVSPGGLDLTVIGITVTVSSAVYDPLTGLLTVTLAGAGLSTASAIVDISISGDSVYMKSTRFTLVP